MASDRRSFLKGLMASAGVATAGRALAQPQHASHDQETASTPGGGSRRGGGIVPSRPPTSRSFPGRWTGT